MSKNIKILISMLVIVGAVVGAAVISKMPEKPLWFEFIEEKLNSIITPKPPIGDLTPVRDLRGTWKSSLSKKGLQVYGRFVTGSATTTVYEDGDIELVIDSVKDNIASGKIRYTDLCGWGQTVAPKPIGTIVIPKTCVEDSGYFPIEIRVSGSALDFGTFTISGVTFTMQGTYTTDIMVGSMTATIPAYGVLKGVFNLSRQR